MDDFGSSHVVAIFSSHSTRITTIHGASSTRSRTTSSADTRHDCSRAHACRPFRWTLRHCAWRSSDAAVRLGSILLQRPVWLAATAYDVLIADGPGGRGARASQAGVVLDSADGNLCGSGRVTGGRAATASQLGCG